MSFASLANFEGEAFLRDCRRDNKSVMVWTVNNKEEMMECVRMGVQVILTDNTRRWLDLRQQLSGTDADGFSRPKTDKCRRSVENFVKTSAEASGPWYHLWLNWKSYYAARVLYVRRNQSYLVRFGGPIEHSITLSASA